MSALEKVINGSTVESYRYHGSLQQDPSRVTRKIEATKEKMKRKKPSGYFKELVPTLVNCGYLKQSFKSSNHSSVRNMHLFSDSSPFQFVPLTLGIRLQPLR